MRSLFPGFYKRSDEELSIIWQEGTFVFDTNMLLNVYRYSSETRDRFFDILTRLNAQIWMPYQVEYEYQENRISVISEQINAYNKVIKLLESTLEDLKNGLEPFKRKHAFIDPVQLMEGITREVTNAKSQVQRKKNNHPNYKKQ